MESIVEAFNVDAPKLTVKTLRDFISTVNASPNVDIFVISKDVTENEASAYIIKVGGKLSTDEIVDCIKHPPMVGVGIDPSRGIDDIIRKLLEYNGRAFCPSKIE